MEINLTKKQKIALEIERLERIFKDLDENKLETVRELIRNAAFISVCIDELQLLINTHGYTVEYQNGENQSGTKQNDDVKTHIAYSKQQHAMLKMLADLAPVGKKKSTLLEALQKDL